MGALPPRPIEKGIAGPGLLAHILISKYVDHLPLYRQLQQFRREGIRLPPSTLDGWVKSSCRLLMPLAEALKGEVMEVSYLMADETPIRVQDRHKKGKTHQGYYWVYYDPLMPKAYFDYRKSRSRAGPNDLLSHFEGFLQTDAYNGYDEIIRRKEVTPVGCMAHARRKFFDAQNNDPVRADWMLKVIKRLYKIEHQAKEAALSYPERHRFRKEQAGPILLEMKRWLDKEVLNVLPKSAIGKAIGYMLNQWSKLENYLLDGRLEIDNNLVENAIRPVALGRKNYLFAGSHDGAKRAAVIYSLLATAKAHEVNCFEYLKDVLTRISDYPYRQIADLLPDNWKNQFSK